MARYIDTQKVTVPRGFFNKNLGVPDLLKWLEAQPAADVVEVVRCKDCCFSAKHPTSDVWKICTNGQWNTEYYPLVCDNDFCSYGRRKDEISKATDS